MLKIQIILGSTRQNRTSEMVGRWIMEEAKKKEGLDVELLDLRDYPLPMYDEPNSPSHLHGKYSNEVAIKWVKKIGEGDAYIIIAPEYNHGYPAVLKNAMDYPYFEWNKKPAGFVAYGSVGGARSVEQLRQVAIELQMAPISKAVHIQGVSQVFDENGKPKDDNLNKKAESFLEELLWWANALKNAR